MRKSNNLKRLFEVGHAQPILAPASAELSLPHALESLSEFAAGFYAFDGALLVRPMQSSAVPLDVIMWNAPALWRGRFSNMDASVVFFAEDLFGNQFGASNAGVTSFDPETGEQEIFATNIDEFAERIINDTDFLTGQPLIRAWRTSHGQLKPGCRLIPRTPFVLGGAFTIENLIETQEVEAMRIRAGVAEALRGVPDGASIEFVKPD